ncbi:MAG: class II aldolase/adducin family protein [Thermoleophilaceae bacterium]
MANHGAVTVADTVEEALDLALLLEWAASVYLHAVAAGRPRELDESQRAAVIEASLARGYGTTKAAAGRGPVEDGE